MPQPPPSAEVINEGAWRAAQLMIASEGGLGPAPESDALGPVRIMERFCEQQSRLRFCSHPYDPTGIYAWLPYLPDQLFCSSCAQRENERIAGTEEDRRCDSCSAVVTIIQRSIVHVPAADHPFGIKSPAVLILAGLCERCMGRTR